MALSAWHSGLLGAITGLAVVGMTAVFALQPMPIASAQSTKPGGALNLIERIAGTGKPAPAYNGTDTCRYANDLVCDEPGLGVTDACAPRTDYSDCWRIAAGTEDDTCQWANDGVCDEPDIGTNNCTQATDRTDCAAVTYLRFQTDACATAFDGVCNEPGTGNGTCAARSDRSDCLGRDRPMEINDHFQGHDDRERLDAGLFPWTVIGRLIDPASGECTATLIAEDIIISAAHCIEVDGRIDARAEFLTGAGLPGGAESAQVVSYFVSPRHYGDQKRQEFEDSDWLLLRLDRPLGRELGFLPSLSVDGANALGWEIRQAGYGWDTGDTLAGHLGCSILRVNDDNTIQHDCDTTSGDSGSPLMAFIDGHYSVVAVDSRYADGEDGHTINVAVRSNEWIGYLADFQAGRIGLPVVLPRTGKGEVK